MPCPDKKSRAESSIFSYLELALMGALRSFFVADILSAFFFFRGIFMGKRSHFLAHSAIIAALYTILCYLQNLILPGSASWAIQMRAAEALSILAFFTPAAIPGLGIGCLLFNLSFAGALPLDFLVGTLASILAAGAMYLLRNAKLGKLPVLGLLMPGVFNAFLVGWELTVYIGGAFWLNALYVAIGEWIVLLTLGTLLYSAIRKRSLDSKLFH